jgi:hypothetical protein
MKKILIILTSLLIFLFLSNSSTLAQNVSSEIPENSINTIEDALFFKSSEKIKLTGKKILGEAYIAGEEVYLDNTVDSDLLVGGGSVEIKGILEKDLRVMGGVVTINAQVKGNVSVVGGTVVIGELAKLEKGLVAGGGDIQILGEVAGPVVVAGGNVFIDTKAQDYWQVWTANLKLGENFENLGNFSYHSKDEAQVPAQASMSAVLSYAPLSQEEFYFPQPETLSQTFKMIFSIGRVASFLFTLLIGGILLKILPKQIEEMLLVIKSNFLHLSLKGLLIIILIPIVAVIITLSIIGIPLAIFLFSFYWLLLFLAKILGCLVVGRYVLLQFNLGERRGWALLTGLVIYLGVGYFPIIGFLYRFLVLSAAVAMIYLYLRKEY